MKPNQRVASRYMESRLFGLLSNHITWQDFKRLKNQIQWMFKKGQHKVYSRLQPSGDKDIIVETQNSKIKISGFKQSGSGYSYRNIIVEIDGRIVKSTDNLDEVKHIVSDHFSKPIQ